MFIGPQVDVRVKLHGNLKKSTLFFRTAKRTREHMQVLASSSTAMKVVQKVTREEGGEIEARGVAFFPQNAQQVSNIHRSIHGKPRESDVLYSLMLECKLAQGKEEVFVQDVKAAPEPQSVLFFDWQANDIIRCCTNNSNFSILTVDTTFNLGEFFVTPVTYHHLLLEDVHTGNHPVMVGTYC